MGAMNASSWIKQQHMPYGRFKNSDISIGDGVIAASVPKKGSRIWSGRTRWRAPREDCRGANTIRTRVIR